MHSLNAIISFCTHFRANDMTSFFFKFENNSLEYIYTYLLFIPVLLEALVLSLSFQ